MGIALITIVSTLVYVGVAMLCPLGRIPAVWKKTSYIPRHRVVMTLEYEWYEGLVEAWLKGEERWWREAMVETWPMTQSWL